MLCLIYNSPALAFSLSTHLYKPFPPSLRVGHTEIWVLVSYLLTSFWSSPYCCTSFSLLYQSYIPIVPSLNVNRTIAYSILCSCTQILLANYELAGDFTTYHNFLLPYPYTITIRHIISTSFHVSHLNRNRYTT